jgi:polyisoprenoid-binding protein YceI
MFLTLLVSAQTTWNVVSTTIGFEIKNAGITVNGNINGFNGQIVFDENALAASFLKASVSVATLKTGNRMRDEHLQHANYFDAAAFPKIEMASKKLYRKDNAFEGLFTITLKGKTKEVAIPFTVHLNGTEAVFAGAFTINRRDFDVGGNSLTLSDNVTISIIVNAKK